MAWFGKDKNRTHDGPWILAAQRHILQALEILSGGNVRIENFDTITSNRWGTDTFEERAFSLTATVVGEKLGDLYCRRTVTAQVGRFGRRQPDSWEVGFVGVITFKIEWSDEFLSEHFAVFDYEQVRKGRAVVPSVLVGTTHFSPHSFLQEMFKGLEMTGTGLADREVKPAVEKRYCKGTAGTLI